MSVLMFGPKFPEHDTDQLHVVLVLCQCISVFDYKVNAFFNRFSSAMDFMPVSLLSVIVVKGRDGDLVFHT